MSTAAGGFVDGTSLCGSLVVRSNSEDLTPSTFTETWTSPIELENDEAALEMVSVLSVKPDV